MKNTFQQLTLAPQILKALEACGYITPTPVQSKSIPEILLGHDIVASAQTGTGKTAAFVLPALQKLVNTKPQKKPRILILTPTRELAAQVEQAIKKYGKFLQFYAVNLMGGMAYRQQIKSLTKGVDIVVATPGRLMDHMDKGRIDLSQIEIFILDEADRMLDMGFIDDVKTIAKKLSSPHQTLLFSATVNKQLTNIIKSLLKNPVHIDFSSEPMAPKRIRQIVYIADSHSHKTKLLEHLLTEESIFKAIIFTSTKRAADQLATQLKEEGISAAALHGDLKQTARNRIVQKMRQGEIQFLIATDVAARGIDISDISHVINYDLPRFSEDYVHRIGRTGRAGKDGIAISLVLPNETRPLHNIERYLNQKLDRETIPGLEPKKMFPAASKDSYHADKKGWSKKRSPNSREKPTKQNRANRAPSSGKSSRPSATKKLSGNAAKRKTKR